MCWTAGGLLDRTPQKRARTHAISISTKQVLAALDRQLRARGGYVAQLAFAAAFPTRAAAPPRVLVGQIYACADGNYAHVSPSGTSGGRRWRWYVLARGRRHHTDAAKTIENEVRRETCSGPVGGNALRHDPARYPTGEI